MNKLEFQNEIVNRIDVSCENNKVSHAYIFSGASFSGQIEVAKYLATKVLNATESEAINIDNMNHPNVFHIKTDKQNISKEQVLDMSYEMQTTSMSGESKIFIIEDAQKLSVSAQNSLLKVVEEPDGKSVVIFIVENLNQLLPTIVSRSQLIKFKPVPFDLAYEELVSKYDDDLKLKYALYLDNNNYEQLYDDEEFNNYIDVVYNYLTTYIENRERLITLLEEICYSFCTSKAQMINFVNFLIVNVSSIINYKNSLGTLFDDRLEPIISSISEDELLDLQNKLFNAYEMLQNNVNIKLTIDKLSMERK